MSRLTRLQSRLSQQKEFIAPRLSEGTPVTTELAGVPQRLQVYRNRRFVGWGLFEIRSHKECKFIKELDLLEKHKHLESLKKIEFVILKSENNIYEGIPLENNPKVNIEMQSQVFLYNEPFALSQFETIRVIPSNNGFIFAERNNNYTYFSDLLRESLEQKNKNCPSPKGMIPGLRRAYEKAYKYIEYLEKLAETERKAELLRTVEGRIRVALAHSNAIYKKHQELPNSYRITWSLEDRPNRSITTTVDKTTLWTINPGFCLTDETTGERYGHLYDLAALVSVYREGVRSGLA